MTSLPVPSLEMCLIMLYRALINIAIYYEEEPKREAENRIGNERILGTMYQSAV